MKDIKPTYTISAENANMIADAFWNLKDSGKDGGASVNDRNVRLDLRQNTEAGCTFISFSACFFDKWGKEPMVNLRRVTHATIKDNHLVIEAGGAEVRFGIRDL